MSLLLFIVGLLLRTMNGFYYALTDSSGTSSYIAHISTDSSIESFDFILYHRLSYASSPICSDCVLFNGTLKTYEIPINENAISLYIEYNPIVKTHQIYLFIQCPLLLTISITLPSHHIQYILQQETSLNHQSNTDEFHCVFQQQTDEYPTNTIHYIVYHAPHHIQLYQYHAPLQSHEVKQDIIAPFNITSSIPLIAYCNQWIYFVSLSTTEQNKLSLNVASYSLIDKTWNRNDDIFGDIHFDREVSIASIGIHDTKSSKHTLPMLSILFAWESTTKYDILSWIIDTNIYSIHEYVYNMNSEPILVNDYNIGFILEPSVNNVHDFIYYENINHLLKQLPLNKKHSVTRRRLQKTDPECQDVSANCAHIAKDCDDDIGIANICRATCGQCEQRAFNCSDYQSPVNAVGVCQFPKETPSFCADPDGWFQYFCPITCHHPNCTEHWLTMNPTPAPTLSTTTFESTRVMSTTHTVSTNEDEHKTVVYSTTTPTDGGEEDVIKITVPAKDHDMSLVLILLAVLLVCILMASVLLWICVNIVRLQRDRNYVSYNTVAALYNRTPDYYTHPGCAPSTPDYYTTELHPQHAQRGTFQRG